MLTKTEEEKRKKEKEELRKIRQKGQGTENNRSNYHLDNIDNKLFDMNSDERKVVSALALCFSWNHRLV